MKKALTCMVLIAVMLLATGAMAEGFTLTRLPQNVQLQPVDGVYVLKENGRYEARGDANDVRIEVDADVTLHLLGVQMLMSEAEVSPVTVLPGAKLTLVLANETANVLHAGSAAAGVQAEAGSTLVIRCESGSGHACSESCGSLEARGGDSVVEESADNAEMQTFGTFAVMPSPGDSAFETAAGAGIGGSAGKSSGSILVESGRIQAFGGESSSISGGAPGVGGGGNTETKNARAHGAKITISGGVVKAQGAVGAAGIGGGDWGGEGRNITISGGVVTAQGGDGASGIGGGFLGAGKNIRISGGEVTARGGEEATGIGGGYSAAGSQLVLSGGTVYAYAGAQYDYPRTGKPYAVSPVNDAIGSGAEARTAQVIALPEQMGVAVSRGQSL